MVLWLLLASSATALTPVTVRPAPLLAERTATLRPATLLDGFSSLARQQPLLADTLAAGSLACLGDLLMQSAALLAGGAGYDFGRTFRFAAFRVCFAAPLYSCWLRLLELLPPRAAARKVAADCLVYTPLYQLCFFTIMAIVEGQSPSDARLRCLAAMPSSLPASWAFWMPVQFVTFSMVPLHLRMAWVSFVGVLWNAAMSGFNHLAAA